MTAQDVRYCIAESGQGRIMAKMGSGIDGWSAPVRNSSSTPLMGGTHRAHRFPEESLPVAPGHGMFGNIEYLREGLPDDGTFSLSDRTPDLIACGGLSDPNRCLGRRKPEREETGAESSAWALLWSMILSQGDSVFAAASQLLSDATDPEGFIRQRMRYAPRELRHASGTVLAIDWVAD